MGMTEIERLVAVETKLTSVEVTINKIDQKFDSLIPIFATQSQLIETKASLDKQLVALTNDLENTRHRSTLQTWLTGTMSAIFGAIMAILIQAYFTR